MSDSADGEWLIDNLEDQTDVCCAEPVGPGICIQFNSKHSVENFSCNIVDVGWYVDRIQWDKRFVFIFPEDKE